MTEKYLKTPASRLKYVREQLLRLTRPAICKKYGLSKDSLTAWENGRISLTEKAIDKCIKIFTAENLIVMREWLLTGEGEGPEFSFHFNRYIRTAQTENNDEADEQTLLIKEVEYFKSLTANSIVVLMPDDTMLPFYQRGDYVGGRFVAKDEILHCVGKNCIVQDSDNMLYVRRLAKFINKKTFSLIALNLAESQISDPIISDIVVKAVAPIIWHRKVL